MKHIKEYINDGLIACQGTFESLFDDEDDLLDKVPDQAILDYIKSIVAPQLRSGVEKNFYINNGVVYCNRPDRYGFVFKGTIPSYINFDKESCSSISSVMIYEGISQEDIDKIPAYITHIKCKKLSNVTIPIKKSIDLSKVKSFNSISIKPIDNYKFINLKFKNPVLKDLQNISVLGEHVVTVNVNDNTSYQNIKGALLSNQDISKHFVKSLKCCEITCDDKNIYILNFVDKQGEVTTDFSKGQWRKEYSNGKWHDIR